MGNPIASHMYECFMAEVKEQGALQADPRTDREATDVSLFTTPFKPLEHAVKGLCLARGNGRGSKHD